MKPVQTGEADSPLKSIPAAQLYLGGVSRAWLYEKLPNLETVKLGGRRMILRSSLDALIEASREREKLPPPDQRTAESV